MSELCLARRLHPLLRRAQLSLPLLAGVMILAGPTVPVVATVGAVGARSAAYSRVVVAVRYLVAHAIVAEEAAAPRSRSQDMPSSAAMMIGNTHARPECSFT